MSTKTLGSSDQFVTAVEAAKILGVTKDMVHRYSRSQMLEGVLIPGDRGIHFRLADVMALDELRRNGKLKGKELRKIAVQATISSQRTERKLDDLLSYLGAKGSDPLRTDQDSIESLHLKVNRELAHSKVCEVDAAENWARTLLAIDEPYLRAVEDLFTTESPWRQFMLLGMKLVQANFPAETRGRLVHATNNLRNVAWMYEKTHGGRLCSDKIARTRYHQKIKRWMPEKDIQASKKLLPKL